MTLKESKYFDDLLDRNTRWHEEHKKEFLAKSSTTALRAWKKKSSLLMPGIMVLWGVLFYFFYRCKPSNTALLVLVLLVVLTIAQLMSLLELVLIAFAVLAIWFWFLLKPPNSNEPKRVSADF